MSYHYGGALTPNSITGYGSDYSSDHTQISAKENAHLEHYENDLEKLKVNNNDINLQPKENGYTRFHRIQNIQICLDFLKKQNIKFVNIRPEDILEGNPKLTLGLIWTIILNYQVSIIKTRQQELLCHAASLSNSYTKDATTSNSLSFGNNNFASFQASQGLA
uniref:Calponin-homology (CH) domain-containing protein n=1 Tax=Parastrongyloides trichosuri TaxID=131310 RepID=A0A0N5A2H0_PARTI